MELVRAVEYTVTALVLHKQGTGGAFVVSATCKLPQFLGNSGGGTKRAPRVQARRGLLIPWKLIHLKGLGNYGT